MNVVDTMTTDTTLNASAAVDILNAVDTMTTDTTLNAASIVNADDTFNATTVNSATSPHMVVNDFGHEDTSYISTDLLRQRFLARTQGVVETVRDVHMNKDHPENMNVVIVSHRRGLAAIRRNGAWQHEPVSVVVDKLIFNGLVINMRQREPIDVSRMTGAEMDAFSDHTGWVNEMIGTITHENTHNKQLVTARQHVRISLGYGLTSSLPHSVKNPGGG
jgi:hypothetical protein